MTSSSASDHPLLSIVGPTATGKTQLALDLAEQLVAERKLAGVDLISADSRQVYQGLAVVSGADLPEDFQLVPAEVGEFSFWQQNSIRLHGVAIIKPDQEWSVAHFRTLAQAVIKQAWAANRLPVLVGGTGLYHKHALSTDPRLHVPPNPELRAKAETKTLSELQSWLAEMDSQALAEMTDSDQKNPRRLIRTIEKAAADPLPQLQPVDFPTQINQLSLGLELPLPAIESKIQQRVKQRFQQGALPEVEALVKKFPDRSLSVFSATGVAQMIDYLDGKITQDQAMADWALREFQYAKRQFTWWKKDQPSQWFAADTPNLLLKVSALLAARL